MLTNEQKTSLIDKICKSEEFKKRDVYIKLLKYLLDCHLTNSQTKEYQIAVDVLEKEKGFDSSQDTSVRYRIHKLRELINKYYQFEGANETICIEIPKGVYKLVFNEKEEKKTTVSDDIKNTEQIDINKTVLRNKRITTINGTILSILSLILVYFLLFNNNEKATKYDDLEVWDSYFNNDYENLLIIGDFYIFHEQDKDLGFMRRIMDYNITNERQLKQFGEKFKDRVIEKHSLGEAPHNSLYNILDLQPIFTSRNKSLELKWTTSLKMDEVNEKNIVYIGEFRNIRLLDTFLENLPITHVFDSSSGKHSITINDPGLDKSVPKVYEKLAVSPPMHAYNDYGMVIKIPGFNGENYMLFIGLGYIAQIQIVKLFSIPEKARELEEKIKDKIGNVPEYFQVLFRTTGYNFTDYASELIYISEIDKDEYLKTRSQQGTK
ncbi:MAG: hypothetical protein JEY94_01290 [Melioribacteraceae bacterium]|nr:hypothetical protein [Melioribacteraceae bacterium]